jgi:hypothetical protein
MRAWTRDLHARLQLLGGQCYEVVARTSLYSKESHALQLLEAAARQSDNAGMRRAAQANAAALGALHERLDADWRQVRARLTDLDQLGTMAVVLSRSAMIEAATGTAEQRAQLGHVSQEFYQHSQRAVQTIKNIVRQVRED